MNRFHIIFIVLCIAAFTSCSKEAENDIAEANDFQIDRTKFSLSVDNNILVFENLDALYACTDYLNEIGNENLDAFEKAIGFQSYRSFNRNNTLPTPLIATMINPENKIIVGDKLFEIAASLDSLSVFEMNPELNICELEPSKVLKRVSVRDNLLALFPENETYKSTMPYCGANTIPSTPVGDFRVEVTIKMGNYDWVFWNVLEATISKGANINSMELGVYTVGSNFYRGRNKCASFSDEASGTGFSYTISKSTPPLIAYRYEVEFWVYDGVLGDGAYRNELTCNPWYVCIL